MTAEITKAYKAGVRDYKSDYYVLDYEPKDTDLLCAFQIEPAPGTSMEEAAAAVAAESSTGTWTEVWGVQLMDLDFYKAKVYKVEGSVAYIAYPMDLFEENSVVNIMSSIVGNVFGMKAISALRLLDMRMPIALVKTFPGPGVGIYDERVWSNKWDRPLIGGTVKPKLGLPPKAYATIIYESLMGGLDTTKDDENMNSQPFSRWRDRFMYAQEAVEEAMAETGEFKGQWHNVTANSTFECLRRIEYVKAKGAHMFMFDFITAGFAASAAGGDHLHTGTVVGKLEGSRRETLGLVDLLRERYIPADPQRGIFFDQDFAGLKSVWPTASGGINVHHVPELIRIFGNDSFLLFGGGTHGHPKGSRAGGRANRVAVEAVARGETLAEAAKNSPELRDAMALWADVKFDVEK
ncbi:MAG: RuBisCO large subunit C-terminal-like domain-containing protein [Anaerolineae bacterium]